MTAFDAPSSNARFTGMADVRTLLRRSAPRRGLRRAGAGAAAARRDSLPAIAARMTHRGPRRHDPVMDLPAPLAWMVDKASASPGPDRFLAELGSRLLALSSPLKTSSSNITLGSPASARATSTRRR